MSDAQGSGEAATPAGESASVSTGEEQQSALDAALARAEENYRSWQRSAADFANFKRRVDEDKKYATRWLLGDLLPVLDDFERAWASISPEVLKLSWVQGVYQINARVLDVLQRHGVTAVESNGKPFSPVEHEAIMRDEELDAADQTHVVAELQRGYRLHERVLRAALVKVGTPPATAQNEAGSGGASDSSPGPGATETQ